MESRTNNGQSAGRSFWDDGGVGRSSVPLEMILEDAENSSSSKPPPTRGTRTTRTRSVAWPFHSRQGSSSASTTLSNFSGFRWANLQPRSFFQPRPDDATSIARSIVPDYVLHYMRGETPESLARKREEKTWGQRDVNIEDRRDTYASCPVEFGHFYSSSTDLTRGATRGGNGYGSASRHSGLRRHFTGWRGGVVYNTIIFFLILVGEIALLIVVLTKTRLLAGDPTMWTGDCGKVGDINVGLHAVISVFSVVFLAGGNYVFQVLTSPTRGEVDKAHESKRWLDIGVTSMRNFAHISSFRAFLGSMVLFTAISIQVIYNAVIYVSREEGPGPRATCSLNLNGPLFGTVMLLNLALVLSTAAILAARSSPSAFEPLATLGDAIRSFLRAPDPTTAGACLLTKRDVRRGRWGEGVQDARHFVPKVHRWLHTPSLPRWGLTALAWLAVCGPAAAGLALLVTTARGSGDESAIPIPSTTLFPLLGSPYTTFASPAQPVGSADSQVNMAMMLTVLLASLPRLLPAVLYLAVNALLTTYFLGHEFALFAAGAPRPLRVSSLPAGQQTTSLYLTLPRPVSWVLLVLFAGIGFLTSQAVWPLVISTTPSSSAAPRTVIAVNTTSLLALLAALAALALGTLGLGLLRRAPFAPLVASGGTAVPGNPLAQALRGGSCSAVVSAACHPPHGAYESARGCVAWGVVDDGGEGDEAVARCAFTSNLHLNIVGGGEERGEGGGYHHHPPPAGLGFVDLARRYA
ncbi:hypothetical protein DL764_009800 [Monosporascus ibericus]|uniref:DUF6536 domain-containing protein n=1 Tax=Monosporascus ibericus TaxID=155417 RepID=A0A4V1X8V8_9PEZI|nr:hypothetical protein DL764_009800 [Monosporascus ibericus]